MTDYDQVVVYGPMMRVTRQMLDDLDMRPRYGPAGPPVAEPPPRRRVYRMRRRVRRT